MERSSGLLGGGLFDRRDLIGRGEIRNIEREVRSIVEWHGGRIWADDLDGRGATFRMSLPPRASV